MGQEDAVDVGFKAPLKSRGITILSTFKGSVVLLFAVQAMLICIFGACAKVTTISDNYTNRYYFFTGVVFMIFFGFGYLMTFLKRYGMGAVGFTLLLSAIAIQWGILTEAFFQQLYFIEDNDWRYVEVQVKIVEDAFFVAAGILISFGAVIGKTTPLQLIVMAFIECIFFTLNKRLLLLGVVEFVDVGGSINIHMFGAYFGLAVTWWMGKPATSAEAEGGHISDLFSLIGTLFLWIYWPSFNAAPLPAESPQQQRAVVNTILCLTFTVTSAFFMSSFLNSTFKFRPVDIQNATIAGGVAIGAVADFTLSGSDIALIGLAAGSLSVFGYSRVLEPLEHKLNLHDTCGIHNLHGMPSLLAGVISIIVTAVKSSRSHDTPPNLEDNGRYQPLVQLFAILFTLAISISSGFCTGWIMSRLTPDSELESFSDTPWWDVMDDFGRSIEDSEKDLEQKLKSSLLELQLGLKTAEELKELMIRYENMEETGSYDSDGDSEDEEDEEIAVKLSNLVPSRHKASTMFGAGHAKSSMTTSRHQGGGFTGQRALNSSLHGGGRAAIAKQNLNSSRHSGAGLMNRSQHSNVSR